MKKIFADHTIVSRVESNNSSNDVIENDISLSMKNHLLILKISDEKMTTNEFVEDERDESVSENEDHCQVSPLELSKLRHRRYLVPGLDHQLILRERVIKN